MDFLALAALVLSVGAALAQVVAYVRGPEVEMIPPDQVTIFCAQHSATKRYPHFSMRGSYVNTGAANYNAAVASEALIVKLGDEKGQTLNYAWTDFESLYQARQPGEVDQKALR